MGDTVPGKPTCGARILWIKDLKLRKMDMRFGTWNIQSRLYRGGSLITVAKEIPKYELDLVEVQEAKRVMGSDIKGGTYE
jgi:hypothetical protein